MLKNNRKSVIIVHVTSGRGHLPTCPQDAASIKGVWPFSFWCSTEASFSSRTRTTSSKPPQHA